MAHPGPKQLSATSAFVQSAGAKLLIIGLNAVTGILTARALAPAGRGELSAMMLWYIFLASVFSFGVPSALTYRLRRHPEQISELSGARLDARRWLSAWLLARSGFSACRTGFRSTRHRFFFLRVSSY